MGLPLLGNLPEIVAEDLFKYATRMNAKYGPVVKVRDQCTNEFCRRQQYSSPRHAQVSAGTLSAEQANL